jgi:hypothetical protein
MRGVAKAHLLRNMIECISSLREQLFGYLNSDLRDIFLHHHPELDGEEMYEMPGTPIASAIVIP